MNALLRSHPIFDVNFVRGDACALFDDTGRQFLDFESGSWAAVLGHGHPAVTRTLQDQATRLLHLGVRTPNHLAREAAGELLGLLGLADGRCTFLSSGSEAVEFGIQAIRRLSPKPLLLTFSNAYLGAVGSAARRDASEWHLLDWRRALECPVEEVLRDVPFDRISGFVFEPGGGAPGFVRFAPADLIAEVARRVAASGGVVMVNEVTTGFGRTGRWFGYQHYGLSPDVVAVGKGLGNGYPVSAVALRSDLAERLEQAAFHHAQSHQNNPLGCAVALTVIRCLREERLVERGAHVSAQLLASLSQLAATCPIVLEARGRGMLLALELRRGCGLSGETLHAELWRRRMIVAGYPASHASGTGIRLDPALTLDQGAIASLLGALAEILHDTASAIR